MKKSTAQIIFNGGQNGEMLEAIADVVGKQIIIQRAGQNSAGDVVKLGNDRYILSPRISENDDQTKGPWEMHYSIGDDGKIAWVFLGHKILGPCFQRGSDGKWCNCYSHGNFGKNYASGGNWSGAARGSFASDYDACKYDTLEDCIAGRTAEIEAAKASDNPSHKIFLNYAAIPAIMPELI